MTSQIDHSMNLLFLYLICHFHAQLSLYCKDEIILDLTAVIVFQCKVIYYAYERYRKPHSLTSALKTSHVHGINSLNFNSHQF